MTSRSSSCPRCGQACLVGAHHGASCSACFTSFRADDPQACLTKAERLFTPAPEPMPGQAELNAAEGWDG